MAEQGPKVGDARSLWNFTPSPGWTKPEVENLVIVLKKFGVGKWVQIVDSGALPGKQIQQLNGQTQRLLGKQSLAEYTGLQLDVLAVKQANDQLVGETVVRKNGLITNQGGKMSKDELKAKREENVRLFGLTPEQIEAIEIPKPVRDAGLGAAAYMGKNHNKGGVNGGLGPTKRVVNVDEVKVEELSSNEKVEVLKQLRKRLLAVRMANTAASENSEPGETTTAMKTSTTTTTTTTTTKNANATVKDVTNVVANEAKKTAGVAAGKRAAVAKKPAAKKTKKSKKSKNDDDDDNEDDNSPSAEGPVEMLVNMGFTKKMAKDAIKETGGDISAATEWLFANT